MDSRIPEFMLSASLDAANCKPTAVGNSRPLVSRLERIGISIAMSLNRCFIVINLLC